MFLMRLEGDYFPCSRVLRVFKQLWWLGLCRGGSLWDRSIFKILTISDFRGAIDRRKGEEKAQEDEKRWNICKENQKEDKMEIEIETREFV